MRNIIRWVKKRIIEYNQVMTQVAVRGQIWNMVEIGSGDGVPILILHGWGRSSNEWVEMAKVIGGSTSSKLYVVDLPGFGGSNIPDVKSIFEYSKLVVELCQYLKIPKLRVVGHSLGGRVAIVMAANNPEMVEQIILIDPAGVKQRSVFRSGLKILAKLFSWVPKTIRARVSNKVMDEDYRNNPHLRDLYRAIVKDDLRNQLKKIQCPALVVWGENDPVLPVSLTKIYRRYLPDSTVRIVWGAGHDPHLSHSEQTLDILKEYIT